MSLAIKLTSEDWDHDEGAHRIEGIASFDSEISDELGKLALRFISEKGLSNEFADLLEEIQMGNGSSPGVGF
ncbi:hypothetical protein KUV57_11635 [Epibacterium sp. DP7N7-1]|nr:hypothetical protein [Epibacterium sp. DP7N7-1]